MEKVILTSSYNNVKKGVCFSISKDSGKDAGYSGNVKLNLAPKEEFFRIWKNNRGKISEKENNLYYIKEFYNKILKKLDPEEILESLPNNSVLLCYEENMDFCHRHLVAFWLELFLNIKTYEVKEKSLFTYEIQDRPKYLKNILEEVIKENYNMHGFKSIRAAYLFESAEQLEKNIDNFVPKNYSDDYVGELYTIVARLRIEADDAEEAYILEQNKVKKYTK